MGISSPGGWEAQRGQVRGGVALRQRTPWHPQGPEPRSAGLRVRGLVPARAADAWPCLTEVGLAGEVSIKWGVDYYYYFIFLYYYCYHYYYYIIIIFLLLFYKTIDYYFFTTIYIIAKTSTRLCVDLRTCMNISYNLGNLRPIASPGWTDPYIRAAGALGRQQRDLHQRWWGEIGSGLPSISNSSNNNSIPNFKDEDNLL